MQNELRKCSTKTIFYGRKNASQKMEESGRFTPEGVTRTVPRRGQEEGGELSRHPPQERLKHRWRKRNKTGERKANWNTGLAARKFAEKIILNRKGEHGLEEIKAKEAALHAWEKRIDNLKADKEHYLGKEFDILLWELRQNPFYKFINNDMFGERPGVKELIDKLLTDEKEKAAFLVSDYSKRKDVKEIMQVRDSVVNRLFIRASLISRICFSFVIQLG